MKSEPHFVSRQTIDARRFYLDLDPEPGNSLTVVCGGVERMEPDYVVERADFPYYAIELVSEGNGKLDLSGEVFNLARGVVFAYGPKTAHRIENVPPGVMRKYYLDFVGAEAKSLLQDAGLLEGRPLLIGRVTELTDLWEAIDREAHDDSDLSREIIRSLTRVLLLKVRQHRISDRADVPVAYRTYESVREYMQNHYLTATTIEQVAEACEISPVYLSRLFKQYSGTGAYRFLLRLRMNYAAELIMERGMMVREVAEVLDYADAFQFSRAFKRIYGVPPKKLLDTRK